MIGDAGRLLVANALFLAAGLGVRRLMGSAHGGRTPSGFALTYLVGLASFGVVAQALLVAGFALTRFEAICVTLVLLGSGFFRPAGAAVPPVIRSRNRRHDALFTPLIAAVVVVVGIRSFYEPLASWDAWAFWISTLLTIPGCLRVRSSLVATTVFANSTWASARRSSAFFASSCTRRRSSSS